MVHLAVLYEYGGVYRAGGVRYEGFNSQILELLLHHGCNIGPVRTKHHSKDVKLSALAIAMDSGSLEAINKILSKYDATSMDAAVSITHGPDRILIALPVLAYAMGLGNPVIVKTVMDRCNQLKVSPLVHPIRRLTSAPPWETPRTLFGADCIEVFPEDIWSVILEYLDPKCLGRMELVSRSLHDVICMGHYWKTSLIGIKKRAELTSPQYARIKGRGMEPFPSMSVANPKHVVGHAIKSGIFLRNCRCLNAVEPSVLASSHAVEGFRTRSSTNVSAFTSPLVRSQLLERHLSRNKICNRSKDEELKSILLALSVELKQNTNNQMMHSVVMSFSRDENGEYLCYVIHPMVRAVQLLNFENTDDDNTNEIITILKTLSPSKLFGNFILSDAHDEPLEDESIVGETAPFYKSLLGASIQHSRNAQLLQIVWDLSKTDYSANPRRYEDIRRQPLLDYCIECNNDTAVALFLDMGCTANSQSLHVAVRRASEPLFEVVVKEFVKESKHLNKATLRLAVLRGDPTALMIINNVNKNDIIPTDYAADHAAWSGRLAYLAEVPETVKTDPVVKKRILAAAIGSGNLSIVDHMSEIKPISQSDYCVSDIDDASTPESESDSEDDFIFSAKNAHSRRFAMDPPTASTSEKLPYDARRLDLVDPRCAIAFELNDQNRIQTHLLPDRTFEQLSLHVIPPLFMDEASNCGLVTREVTTSLILQALGCKSKWDDREYTEIEPSRCGRFRSGMWHAAHLSDVQLRHTAINRHIIVTRSMMIHNVIFPVVCRVHFGTLDTKHIQVVLTLETYQKAVSEGEGSPTLLKHVQQIRESLDVRPLFWVFSAPTGTSDEPGGVVYELVFTAVSPTPTIFLKINSTSYITHSKELFYQNNLDNESSGGRCLFLIPPRTPTNLTGMLVGSKEIISRVTVPVVLSLPGFDAFPVPSRCSNDLSHGS
eukprot:TRINITY_DN8937_c0_g1_i1.p1 TRINITY_DN8937_c0_g1~~TRINITY_DN8937_c0_g1_i1.p1  ORF type:complete len:943 (+),score=137.40 TRINITY_DN8937_c0_g1_i1:1298-4126(+)